MPNGSVSLLFSFIFHADLLQVLRFLSFYLLPHLGKNMTKKPIPSTCILLEYFFHLIRMNEIILGRGSQHREGCDEIRCTKKFEEL